MTSTSSFPGNMILLTYLFKAKLLKQIEKNNLSLTIMHFEVLKIIHIIPNCTSLVISEILIRDKAQVTRLVCYLIDQKWVRKIKHPKDKRSSLLVLTRLGKKKYDEVQKLVNDLTERLIKNLSHTEFKQFSQIIQCMFTNIKGC